MNTPPRKNHPPTEAPESPESNETFPERTKPPGEAGLANEARPGLGTRGDEPFPGDPETKRPPASARSTARVEEKTLAQRQRSSREPNDQPLPREPREQAPDSWAHEAERSTGVSGHMSG